MRHHKSLIAIVVITALTATVVSPVAAHETQEIEGYDVTFGGADEPVITGERMWMEFEIVDNETEEPIENQSENLTVSVQTSGSDKTALEVSEKHGEPGVYEAPVIFTEPGEYVLHLEGDIEGTEVHTHFEKEVNDHTELEYPSEESETEDNSNESQTDDQTEEAGFGSLSIVIAAIGGIAAVGAALLRRRR